MITRASGAEAATPGDMSMIRRKRLEISVQTPDGASYATVVEYRQRPDAMWEAWLAFDPAAAGRSFSTVVQTTQSSERAVLDWAAGLSVAHVENAFSSAVAPVRAHDGGVGAEPTPARPAERLKHLRPVERDVLSIFTRRKATTIPTRDLFDLGPHANADFVRAFEDLEKQWRYLVRRTVEGVDLLQLTVEGARVLGIPADPGSAVEIEPPREAR